MTTIISRLSITSVIIAICLLSGISYLCSAQTVASSATASVIVVGSTGSTLTNTINSTSAAAAGASPTPLSSLSPLSLGQQSSGAGASTGLSSNVASSATVSTLLRPFSISSQSLSGGVDTGTNNATNTGISSSAAAPAGMTSTRYTRSPTGSAATAAASLQTKPPASATNSPTTAPNSGNSGVVDSASLTGINDASGSQAIVAPTSIDSATAQSDVRPITTTASVSPDFFAQMQMAQQGGAMPPTHGTTGIIDDVVGINDSNRWWKNFGF